MFDVIKTEKQIPDANGGWYWLKLKNQNWTPVFVKKAVNGWPSGIDSAGGHFIECKDVDGIWGPRIEEPSL